MPINQLPLEVLNIGGVPDDGLHAVLVGDTVSFAPQQTFAAPTTTLPRKPAGSAASVTSNAVTFDVAGYYTVTVAAGGFTRTITVVAFPTAVTNTKVGPLGASVGRTHLQSLIRDSRVTLASIGTALENANPVVGNAIVGGGPFNWNSYV